MNDPRTSTDAIDRFAAEAGRFERWLLDGVDRDAAAAREALMRLLALYRASLDLPSADEVGDGHGAERVSDADYQRAVAAASRLPLSLYREVFNPAGLEDEESVVGDITDDLADIYSDVASGLRAYEKGDRAVANWEWSFHLHAHWGAHATSAIRALHWWLSEKEFE